MEEQELDLQPQGKLEKAACNPATLDPKDFNPKAAIPHGVTVDHIRAAMDDYLDFLRLINQQLGNNNINRLETILMPANFSSMVGEFVCAALPNHCDTIARNNYHNGHPDMVPKGVYEDDSVQYGEEGIEVKSSRYLKGWQGHNAEDSWLMVFCYEANRQKDAADGVDPMPFRFLLVCGAQLDKETDWKFAGRSETSRRTITAAVTKSGHQKMVGNWIYKAPGLKL